MTSACVTSARRLPGVELVLDDADPRIGRTVDTAPEGSQAALMQGVRQASVDHSAPPEPGRRIVLRFSGSVVGMLGDDARDGAVRGVCLDDGSEVLAGPVVSAIGYGGREVPGLPFDPANGTASHEAGRIDGVPASGTTGSTPRRPSGRCSTTPSPAGCPARTGSPRAFARAVRRRGRSGRRLR